MSAENIKEVGYWFSFKRGSWVKFENGAKHFENGGLAYVGSLTKKQMEELDTLINKYIKGIK